MEAGATQATGPEWGRGQAGGGREEAARLAITDTWLWEALEALALGGASGTGTEFFAGACAFLARATGLEAVCVAEVGPLPAAGPRLLAGHVPLAEAATSAPGGSVDQWLASAWVAGLAPGGGVSLVGPGPDLVGRYGVGMALADGAGVKFGVLAGISRVPLADPQRAAALFRLFAVRAGAELARLRAEEKVRSARRRFLRHLDNLPLLALVLDADGVVDYCNNHFVEVGAPLPVAAELLGRPVTELFPDLAGAELLRQIGAVLAGEGTASGWFGMPAAGGERQIEYRLVQSRGRHVLALLRDVTDQRLAERAALEGEARLQSLIDSLPFEIVARDLAGRCSAQNSASRARWGELAGTSVASATWVPEEVRDKWQRAVAHALRGGQHRQEYVLETEAGGRHYVEALAAPLIAVGGAVAGVYTVDIDRTAQYSLEEQLHTMQRIQAVGELAGGVAHEFNNVLQIISGYTDILKKRTAGQAQLAPLVDKVSHAAGRAAKLTQGLLAYSRKQPSSQRPVDVKRVLQRGISLWSDLLGPDIGIEVNLEPAFVSADAGQLEQVFLNLATNARDAMAGGGCLAISAGVVTVPAAQNYATFELPPGEYAQIRFCDNGQGMPDEVRRRVFDPFFTTKEVGRGTGLGLSVVYGIIKQHGGYIDCISAVKEGTAFTIYLPLLGAAPEEAAPTEVQPDWRGTETVLVAEDDAGVRELLVGVLREAGYRVLEAGDGTQAVSTFAALRGEIDCLLFDVMMPNLGGVEALRSLRREFSQLPPALVMSGQATDALRCEVGAEGLAGLLPKPFQAQEVLAALRAALEEKLAPAAG